MNKKANRKLAYDYIVVGSGPAGAVLAKTLSDDKSTSVLLVEAGGNHDRDLPIQDSTFAPTLEESFTPEYFWQGQGVPQEGLNERSLEWTTGRLAGGGSSINGEQYVRPTSAVFREWEALLGPTWSPRAAIRRFKELESYNGKTDNPAARGFHGRVDIRQAPKKPTAMAHKLVSAITAAADVEEILDYNDPNTPIGAFTQWQLFQQPNGNRESASTAYLSSDIVSPDGRGRKGRKLRVLHRTTTLRVIFEGKRAVGVELLKDGRFVRAFARKKVIPSAGINSAQLLLLSGVGPSQQLKAAGVPVVFNNPNVGVGMRNHTLNVAVFTANPSDLPLPENDPDALYSGGAFLPDPTPGSDPDLRGVQLVGLGNRANHTLTLVLIYLKPKSRGTIQIQSNDPLQIVLADEAFLKDEADLEAVKEIYRVYVRNIAAELAKIDPTYQLVTPSLDVIDNDEELENFIKDTFGHNHHQQSALRAAPLSQGGAVDRLGNVHGVENLIVADASFIPFTVDGNTSAPAFLIGLTIARHLRGNKRRTGKRRRSFEE